MLSKQGNCTRLLKIKNKLKIGCFSQMKLGSLILDILWAFLITQLFHSRILNMTEMTIANSALGASLAISHLISNAHSYMLSKTVILDASLELNLLLCYWKKRPKYYHHKCTHRRIIDILLDKSNHTLQGCFYRYRYIDGDSYPDHTR